MTDADTHVKRRHESPELGKASARMMRALAKRGGEGDLDALAALVDLNLDYIIHLNACVYGLRQKGYSWANIAEVFGISRQAAQQRFGGHDDECAHPDCHLPPRHPGPHKDSV